jgi:hypothetical protein
LKLEGFELIYKFFFEINFLFLNLQPRKTGKINDSVAQLVEHRPFKAGVLGSNPSWITNKISRVGRPGLVFFRSSKLA